MRRPMDIRKAEELTVDFGGYLGGTGEIRLPHWTGSVVWTIDKGGWDHVSVSPYDKNIMPTWDDMCRVKDIFFKEEECAIQIHPTRQQYVNIVENCLHLWRPTDPALLRIFEGGNQSGKNQ